MLKKIAISPESVNYGDNDGNIAYLYRGYIIWKDTQVNVGDRGGDRDDWNFGAAVYHTPDADVGETFEPYWDDNGDIETCESRQECIYTIDGLFERGQARPATEAAEADPDAVESVTITVSLNQARMILAALSRRVDELDYSPRSPQAEASLVEARAAYQNIDRQVFQAQ